MIIQIRQDPIAQLPCSALVVYSFEGAAATSGSVMQLPAETRALLDSLAASGELTGKAYECTLVHGPAGLVAEKLLMVGAGKHDKFNGTQ